MTESIKFEEKCKPSFERHCALWGYKTEIDEEGFYIDSLTQRLFNSYYDAWQASRAAIVVKLPELKVRGWVSQETIEGYKTAVDEFKHALDDAEVNYE